MTYTMPVGTSDPADFQLYEEGVALVGTGYDVDLLIYQGGELLGMSPALTVVWLDQTAGTVRVTGAEALEVGTYKFRFTLTDGANKVGFVPTGDGVAHWRVVKVQG
jgi:hypothetical protein